jgi:hypothetical protein
MFLLRRLRPGEAGEGFHSFEGPLAGSTSSTVGVAPDSETQEGTIHLLGSSRMVGFLVVRYHPSSIRAGTVVQHLQSVKPIAIVRVH